MVKFLKILTNLIVPKVQIKRIRGRFSQLDKITNGYYKLSVIDDSGRYLGARFLNPWYPSERVLDKAVESIATYGKCY